MNAIEQQVSTPSILEKAQQITDLIKRSEEMQRFRQAQDKIERHADAQALLFNVKALRNRFSQTSLRHGYEHPESIKAQEAYENVLEQIAQVPLIDEYQVAQEDLNDIVQGVLQTLVGTLSPVLSVEKSEDPGDAASGGCGSCSSGGCGRH